MYFEPEDNHETRIAKRERVKKWQVEHELKMTFLFHFLRVSGKVKTLEKWGGVSSHTWQLQAKI